MFRRLFADGQVPAADDLFALLSVADPSALPALWLGCGSEDQVYADNRRLVDACVAAGVEVTTSWVEGAEHDCALWDSEIQQVLDWLPGRPSRGD